jgi:capsid protein
MAQVELSEFIQNVLIQIAQGVRAANDQLKDPGKHQYEVFSLRHNKGDSSKIPGIKFDVAVTATSQQRDKAGFFVMLANVGGAANTEKSRGDEMLHRIQFEVGVEST